MARINVYLPDELARAARDAGLNVSGLTQDAVRSALAARATDDWLESVLRLPRSGGTHEQAMAALEAARDELAGHDG